jgi:formylglycine-generating enzyme required for sulfatase activity
MRSVWAPSTSAIGRARSRRALPIGWPRHCRCTRTRAVCRPPSARRRATCWPRSATRASTLNASTCPLTTLLGFVRILADPEFRIGTRKADAKRVTEIIGTPVPDHEINDAPTPTPEFYIARYLVTVAQFRGFVEATGFEIGDARALRDPDSRPVCWVSWHEARAYCDWLNKILGHLARAREHRSGTPRARGPMAVCIAKRAGVGKGRSGWSARYGLLLG